ncbi:uncharacterized protein FIESC28_00069 [Fusarium coffeatum]|uniref:Lysine-specific metallo-endopeptidase domain-containing protein n=1 Tax=Fusarium coffeatum TaxID=231269 RepID=A0A366SEQ3_9HYPO|nr:uncharacterized protein FIESC28_00069 [Fusarium coffeatum]RBR27125.1 hypothetical protein FIESC28_00069 [Fusarium coffeatum]
MSFIKGLLFSTSLAIANAKPISPSKVVRAAASPSTFPLGDACENEWKYLNFDSGSDADKAHLQKLHDVICNGELRAVAAWGVQAAEDSKKSTNVAYDVFFSAEEDIPATIQDVLSRIAGQSTTEGKIGKIVGTMIVDNNGKCAAIPDTVDVLRDLDFKGRCDGKETEAYTDTDTDKREKIHFCDLGYDKPIGGGDIQCSSLDKYPSIKIDTFSRVALHETLHYSTVGPASKLDSQIVDQKNRDGDYAYGPERAHGLNDPDQDGQPGKAESNADNYAWMAVTSWVSYLCTPEDEQDAWDSYFSEDPPEY